MHHYAHCHLEILGELFNAEGVLTESRHKPEQSLACYEKSLILVEFLDKNDKTWSAKREQRKETLREQISALKHSGISI